MTVRGIVIRTSDDIGEEIACLIDDYNTSRVARGLHPDVGWRSLAEGIRSVISGETDVSDDGEIRIQKALR